MNTNFTAVKNDTVKNRLKTVGLNTIKLFIVFSFSILASCSDSYENTKPDNKLKKSPCACLEVVFDSRVLS